MSVIHLVRIGDVEPRIPERLRADLSACFRFPCELLPVRLDPAFAFHAERQQYHSTELLERLRNFLRVDSWRLLGVTGADLFIPILTFVFGEAQLGNSCAVVSFHRLRQEFFGLVPDAELLQQRLLKEAVHELGHTFDLQHCADYGCVMAPSHAVEWIDLKGSNFCDACRVRVLASQVQV